MDMQEEFSRWLTVDRIKALVPRIAEAFTVDSEGWECDIETEGGQLNGLDVPESNDSRSWFTDDRESHHRYVVTFIGPWMPGARPEVIERRRLEAEAKERRRAEKEDAILRQAEEIMARRKGQS